jgi:hypothetical protein
MRKQYSDFVTDQNGTVIPGATVAVYLAGATTLATIYSASTGAAITGSTMITGADGSYSFWVDSGDYGDNQAFKIVATMPGYSTFTRDNLWWGPPFFGA